MLQPRTFWTVRCDRCGADAFEGCEFAAYSDRLGALASLSDEWLTVGERHYCAQCVGWDEATDSLVPLPPLSLTEGKAS